MTATSVSAISFTPLRIATTWNFLSLRVTQGVAVTLRLVKLFPFVKINILLVYPYGHQPAIMYPHSSILSLLTLCLSFFRVVHASVTVYGTRGALTTTARSATYTGPQAYNPILLQAPLLPNPAPANTFNIQLANAVPVGSSIKLPGSFMGFSIEFSVLNQLCMCGLLFNKLTSIFIWNFGQWAAIGILNALHLKLLDI